jgi:hypothetical protein
MLNFNRICLIMLSISFFLSSPLLQLPIGAETNVKRSVNVSSPFFFNITLITPSKYDDRVEWALLIEEELNNIGIGVTYHDFVYELDWEIFPRTEPDETTGLVSTYDEGGYEIIF